MFRAYELPDRLTADRYVLPLTVELDDGGQYGPAYSAVIAGDGGTVPAGTVIVIGANLRIVAELSPNTFVRFVDVTYAPTNTPMTVGRMNELLPDLDDASCVVIGGVARDLFDRQSSTGDRTYYAAGHYWTGVECFEGVELCSTACLDAWAAADPWPVITATDVEFNRQYWEGVPTYLNPDTAIDAVAYPFLPADHDAHDWPITCHACGRVMVADRSFADYVDTAFTQYLETALWSSTTGDDTVPMDEDYCIDDIGDDTRAEMLTDVVAFIADQWSDLNDLDAGETGHDFWLTRNGHGAGFWDRGLDDRGDRLTDACRPYGEVDLYAGDDGDLYV